MAAASSGGASFVAAAAASSAGRSPSTRLTLPGGAFSARLVDQVYPLAELTAERSADACRLLSSLDVKPAEFPRHLRRRGRSFRPYRLPRHGKASATGRLDAGGSTTRKRPVKVRRIPAPNSAAGPDEATGEDETVTIRVRKHLRRPGWLLGARAWAPAELYSPVEPGEGVKPRPPRWLETHVWHAKRATMENLWGFRLSTRNNFMGQRALHRSVMRHCCVHDRSYLELFELVGSEDSVVAALRLCGVDSELTLAASVRSGSRRARGVLRRCTDDPKKGLVPTDEVIAPILFLWQPEADEVSDSDGASDSEDETVLFRVDVGRPVAGLGDSMASAPLAAADAAKAAELDSAVRDAARVRRRNRRLWLWVHPAAARDAAECLQRASDASGNAGDKPVAASSTGASQDGESSLKFKRLEGTVFFELMGPRTLEVLSRVFPPDACSGAGAEHWREIAAASAGMRLGLPPGGVLALEVDKQVLRACATPKVAPLEPGFAGSVPPQASHPSWLLRWPATACTGSSLWSQVDDAAEVVTGPAADPTLAIAVAAAKAPGPGVPGAASGVGEGRGAIAASSDEAETGERVPVLIVFRGGPGTGTNGGAGGATGAHIQGADIVVPARTCGNKIWLRCIFANARYLGVRDRHAMLTAAGIPEFPFDFPETAAGTAQAAASASTALERHRRRPPDKRPNYGALAVFCPFEPQWRFASGVDSSRAARALPAVEGEQADVEMAETEVAPQQPFVLRPPASRSKVRRASAQAVPQPLSSVDFGAPFLAVVVSYPGRGVPRALCHLFRPLPGDFPKPPTTMVVATAAAVARRGRVGQSGQAGGGTAAPAVIAAAVVDPPQPPQPWPALIDPDLKLYEPLHQRLKRGRIRKQEFRSVQEAAVQRAVNPEEGVTRGPEATASMTNKTKKIAKGAARHVADECTFGGRHGGVQTLRNLVGFITSGGRSDRQSCGVGVGAICARAFASLLLEQERVFLHEPAKVSGDAAGADGGRSLAGRWVLLWARNPTSLVYYPVWARALRRDEGLG
eukprot:TRINITY_DN40855_c0_g1_i1.p1 TRINITY_DN40855_c0_g1~~TRINITY_DN40855_c0_g1_i1.p1  ORF type:complete len:1030 (-),score=189.86 TRINITY_DN40855_c0_g1_i1:142-3231(-)